jgi:hypothetical protein
MTAYKDTGSEVVGNPDPKIIKQFLDVGNYKLKIMNCIKK